MIVEAWAVEALRGQAVRVSVLRPTLAPYLIGSASAPWLGAVVWRIGGYGLMFAILNGLMALGCGLYLAAHLRADRDRRKAEA